MGRKSKQTRLQVLLNGERLGLLTRNTAGNLEFTYGKEWLEAAHAISVGDGRHYRLGEIRLRHWEQTAKKAGFPLKTLHSLIQDLIDRKSRLDTLMKQISKNLAPTLIDSVLAGIKKHLKCLI